MSSTLKYRPEIDGLRAIAVCAVIIFHINPQWLIGGYLGVDIFFVISGYLITAIIQRNIDGNKFSLPGFWLRRIRRLYPAMTIMVCTVAVAGNYILISPERHNLIKQSIASIFSFSNILLWKTTNGYWSTSSDNIPLLHTWSLSLEEQFYILFPLFLLIFNKYLKRAVIPTTLALTIASLAFSIYWTDIDRSGSFYLLPTRLWELSMGSLLALLEISRPQITNNRRGLNHLATLGLLAATVSFFIIENNQDFPKAMPILPCLGTAMILAFSRHAGMTQYFLKLAPLQFFGKISYSLYLWHWPIIVFSKYLSPDQNTAILLVAITGVASLSYYLIENPFRSGFKGSTWILASMPIVAAACLIPIYIFPKSPGIPEKLADFEDRGSLSRAWQFEATQSLMSGQGGITFGSPSGGKTIALIGSSHARVLGPSAKTFVEKNGLALEVLATSGIEVTRRSASKYRDTVAEVNDARFEYLKRMQPQIIIVAGMWSSEYREADFIKNLEETIRLTSESSEHVLILSQVPMFDLPPSYHGSFRKYLVAKARTGQSLDIQPVESVPLANSEVEETIKRLNLKNVTYIDIYQDLLKDDNTVLYMLDNKLLYSDYHHVNNRGAAYLFKNEIEAAIKKALDDK